MKKQNGATLVIILIIVVIVALVGTFAVKSSILGLKIATNSQVQALLLNSSDSALFNIENPDRVALQLARGGMFDYFSSADNAKDELVFCYRASESSFFSMNKASAISGSSKTKIGVDGYCRIGQFSTGRSAVLSQVYLNKKVSDSTPFSGTSTGTSTGLPLSVQNIHVTVISVLPSFANATDSQIENCFKNTSTEVSTCFKGLNIPFSTQNADYTVGGQPKIRS